MTGLKERYKKTVRASSGTGDTPVKYTDQDGKWFLIDDFIFSLIAKYIGGTDASLWGLTWDMFKRSWNSNVFVHLRFLADIIKEVKPLIEKDIKEDGILNYNDSVSIDEEGINGKLRGIDFLIAIDPKKKKLVFILEKSLQDQKNYLMQN
jgi:hypothetical protein